MKHEILHEDEIIKFFGSVNEFINHLDVKIQRLERDMSEIEYCEIADLFSPSIFKLSINNVQFTQKLVDSKKGMVEVLKEQILYYQDQKRQALKFL